MKKTLLALLLVVFIPLAVWAHGEKHDKMAGCAFIEKSNAIGWPHGD